MPNQTTEKEAMTKHSNSKNRLSKPRSSGIRAAKARRAPNLYPTEDQDQIGLAPWLDARFGYYGWEHVPGQRWAKVQYLVKLKKMGAKKGTLDIRIYKCVTCNDRVLYHGTAVEMKRQKGGRVSPEQRQWGEAMTRNGWKVIFANGALDAINKIEEVYGKL